MFEMTEKERVEINQELKRCPFCSGPGSVKMALKRRPSEYYVECEECRAVISTHESARYAADAWNSRRGCSEELILALDRERMDITSALRYVLYLRGTVGIRLIDYIPEPKRTEIADVLRKNSCAGYPV
jgi:hypothetical protein